MANIVLELDDRDGRFVERTAAERGIDAAAFVVDLIRTARRERALDKLEAMIDEGLNSGEPIPATPEFYEERRRKIYELRAQKAAR